MLDENVLWTAVAARDPRWDGLFVYGVSSTGVFCRPTCPSRRPGRPRVSFFPTPDAAIGAGFRACLRCHPEQEPSSAPAVSRVLRACRTIAARGGSRVPLTVLARAARVSPHQLVRSFKHSLGITPAEYADACRTGCLKVSLRAGRGVADAAYAAGFGSGSRLYERAPSRLGMTPATYAAGARGEDVRYATAASSIGCVLVARTPRGVCAITVGDDARSLADGLAREFPHAERITGDDTLQQSLRAIVAALDEDAPDPRLPLDIRATAFQERVWRELQRIPRGETRTYAQVAARIGQPGAARAVARACASNPVALVVPCHRVVRNDGEPGGYRWGAERKRRLVEAERG